ncbi:MAG: hydrogenase maturation protease [Kiritimatiellales bacterium]|nr:hydrogenase maturation protease [Kiritimatiellales bacterium]
MMSPAERIAVVGMGNLLMSDDGVGVHVVHKLRKKCLEGVELIDAGTAVIHTADCLREVDRIVVVDALKAGHPPGTVYRMSGNEVLENDYSLSVHSLGLKTALMFLGSEDTPADWTLVGVEPETLERGMRLSDAVQEAVPAAMRAVENLIEEWRI